MDRGYPQNKRTYLKNAMRLAKEYLLANPHATNQQVMDATGCKARTVPAARRALISAGLIQPSYYDRRAPESVPPMPTEALAQGQEELRSIFNDLQGSSETSLTPEEMRNRLSALARRASLEGNAALEINAIQAIARLDSQLGSKTTLGPGPPLTRDDKIARLGLILDICGIDILVEAAQKTFSHPDLTQFHLELGRRLVTDTQNSAIHAVPDPVPPQPPLQDPPDAEETYLPPS